MAAKQTPRRQAGGQQTGAGSGTSGTRVTERWFGATLYSVTRTMPHRDPDEPWPVYDTLGLGLAPHNREICPACMAVGA
jgi:hypothetical protein